MKEIKLMDPRSKNFAANYGKMVSTADRSPDARTGAFSFWDRLGEIEFSRARDTNKEVEARKGGPKASAASLGLVQSYPQKDLYVPSLERHRDSPETLIPVNGDIIVTCGLSTRGAEEKVDPASITAVRVCRGEAIILYPGVWHYAPLVEKTQVDTFVIFRHNTLEEDLVKVEGLDLYVRRD